MSLDKCFAKGLLAMLAFVAIFSAVRVGQCGVKGDVTVTTVPARQLLSALPPAATRRKAAGSRCQPARR